MRCDYWDMIPGACAAPVAMDVLARAHAAGDYVSRSKYQHRYADSQVQACLWLAQTRQPSLLQTIIALTLQPESAIYCRCFGGLSPEFSGKQRCRRA